jgi:hypothetical protein
MNLGTAVQISSSRIPRLPQKFNRCSKCNERTRALPPSARSRNRRFLEQRCQDHIQRCPADDVLVPDGQRGQLGALLGLAAGLFSGPGGALEVGRGVRVVGVGAWSVRDFGLRAATADSRMGGKGSGGAGRPAGESAQAPAVPTGSTAARASGGGGRHQTSGPKIAPQPSRTNGPSARARSTRNLTGLGTGHHG